MKKYLILTALILILALSMKNVYAEEKNDNSEKKLTRADVIEKISGMDFFKKKIADLLNWSVGYDITKINRTNLAPTISMIRIAPEKAPPDNRTLVLLMAKVSDPSGPDYIKGVRADLSSIDKLPNMMLVDNGLWGDAKANDSIYTLQTSVGSDVSGGNKEIPVAVSNKAGWVAVNTADIVVQSNPIISLATADPSSIKADGISAVLLTVKVENPGRQEDLKGVFIDLSAIGLVDNVKMWDDGTHGDIKAKDKIYSVTAVVKQGTPAGAKKLSIHTSNLYGGASDSEIILTVE